MSKRLVALAALLALVASGCQGGSDDSRIMTAEFSRAVQVFPGNSVRVLGVDVGRIIDVTQTEERAEVTFRIEDPDLKLPEDVKATLVPVSLLGERYVQLFPAYQAGDAEYEDGRIPIERTSVPAEQDELLQGLQDYFGALDPDKVADFVTNAATILEGNGEGINRLIDKGTGAINVLANKKESLVGLIQELNTLTTSLATRQDAIARVIHSYNAVGRTINTNRDAVEGTIRGLNEAATELASLLIEHRDPLGKDVRMLTRTFRTLERNADKFARTSKWAVRLFDSARRAMNWESNWLRLGNQGAPLFELAMLRLEERLMGVCLRLEVEECSSSRYWEERLPNLFCVADGTCKEGDQRSPGQAIEEALQELPDDVRQEMKKELKKKCKNAKDPKKCRERKKKQSEGDALDDLLDDLMDNVKVPRLSARGSLR